MTKAIHRAPDFEDVSLGDLLDSAARTYAEEQRLPSGRISQAAGLALMSVVLLVIPSSEAATEAPDEFRQAYERIVEWTHDNLVFTPPETIQTPGSFVY